jgi:hypothetical protein
MSPSKTSAAQFCSQCGTRLKEDARFCHNCGAAVAGGATAAPVERAAPGAAAPAASSSNLRWGVPLLAVFALVLLTVAQMSLRRDESAGAMPLPGRPLGAPGAPDISSMSPQERADRLFNRVMTYATQGQADSAAFFAPMAIASIEALAPLDAHRRYDLGLVALAAGDAARAAAQADTILDQRPTHLLGLTLAARAAEVSGATAESRRYWARLLEAETDEIATGLQEYVDHDADLRAAVAEARAP